MKFDASMPRFEIGQDVELKSPHRSRHGLKGGLIVGMVWISRDAALAQKSNIGWSYIIEVDPLTHGYESHFEISEDELILSEIQHECA